MNIGSCENAKKFKYNTRKSCRCPTLGGSNSPRGWDTQLATQRLTVPVPGGVPPVPPLTALSHTCGCACVCAPEKVAVRGGTRGTLTERADIARLNPRDARRVSNGKTRGVGHE